MKPFTFVGAILLLLVAAVHIYRIYAGFGVGIADQSMPMMVSYVAAAVAGIVGLGMLFELRK